MFKKIFVVFFLMSGCACSAGEEKEPEKIKAGDVLGIRLVQVRSREVEPGSLVIRVPKEGPLSLEGLEAVPVVGLSEAEVAKELGKRYGETKIYLDPVFKVTILKGEIDKFRKPVTVGGMVEKPGPKPYQDNLILAQVVEMAGGGNAFGSLRRVKLYRNRKVYTYDLSKEGHGKIRLYPGDGVEVTEKDIFDN